MPLPTAADLIHRSGDLVERLNSILRDPPVLIRQVLANKATESSLGGVYIITTPDDGEVVYVGLTRSVLNRLYEHINTGTDSDLGGMLKRWPDYPSDRRDYLVRWVVEEDVARRKLVEHFFIAVLEPTFNR